MHLQLNDSSVPWEPGDVLSTSGETTLASALATLVGPDRTEQLLRRVGPNGLEHMNATELATSAGVPHACAERIVAARSFASAVRERRLPGASRPERLMAALPRDFGRLEREVLLGIALTGTNRVKAVVLLSVGGIAGAAVLPRDVFMPMIRHGASGFALAHNHPSADKIPSRDDIALTNALSRGGALLGIPLVDHLVVARDGFTSMYEAGLLLNDAELAPASLASAR
jgi:DNA repair protein RadC